MNGRTHRRTIAVLLGFALAVSTTACSSDADDAAGADGALPDKVSIDLLADVTGLSSTFAAATIDGWKLRVEQADTDKELGDGTAVTTKVHDSQSDPKVAAGVIGDLAGGGSTIVGYGTSSAIAPAIAPIAQDAGLPFVAMYAGSPDLTAVGDQIFRITAPQSTYHDLQSQYFVDNGIRNVAIIYNNDIGSLKGLAEEYYPEAAERFDFSIVSNVGIAAAATDISAEMSGVIDKDPDAVLMLVLSQQNTSVVTQLQRAGYDGLIAAQPGIGLQTLEALGAAADGIVYPIDFTADTQDKKGKAFVEAFTAKYGHAPDSFAAAGFDGASIIVDAVRRAGSMDRAEVQKALVDITNEGFAGVTGSITFEERDARVPGLMVRWVDGGEELLES